MFNSVFGHQRIKDVLERTVARDHLHHGLCFHGPPGIGKRLMAQELAMAMLCDTREGCGTCKNCHKFKGGNHPDYREVSPDGTDIKVDQIREISENLHFRPFEGSCRVIVLDGVERFREEAANAFLKSLEEPPDYVYFILVTSDIKGLLPTIGSRCQKVGFQSLANEDKTMILTKRFNIEESMATRLASISFRQLETEEVAWDHFVADTRQILVFYRMMFEQGHAIDLFNDQIKDKNKFPRFHDHLLAVTRELTFLALDRPAAPLFNDFKEDMAALAVRASAVHWRETWESLTRLGGMRRLHLNMSLWFNTLSVIGLNLMEAEEAKLKQRLAKVRR